MSRLVKDLYKGTTPDKRGLFGLYQHYNEHRQDIGTSVWYNVSTERMGSGRLNGQDWRRIAENLEEGEYFFLVDYIDDFGAYFEQRPPIDLRKDAFCAIAKGIVYSIRGTFPDYFYTDDGGLRRDLFGAFQFVLFGEELEAVLPGHPSPSITPAS